jgi:hypothetical protein
MQWHVYRADIATPDPILNRFLRFQPGTVRAYAWRAGC